MTIPGTGRGIHMGMFGRYIILFIGVAAGAVSIVFIKASSLHPVALASFRQLLAAFLLLPLYLKSRRGVERATSRRAAVASILPDSPWDVILSPGSPAHG